MKKIIAYIICLTILGTLCACDKTASQPQSPQVIHATKAETAKDTEPNTEEMGYHADDEFTFEDVGYEVDSFGIIICFKFRNISDKHLDRASFTVQMLDTNGDIIDTKYIGYIDGIDPGQGVWYEMRTEDTKECSSIQELSERVHSFKIVSLDATEDDTDNYGYYSLDFKNPIIIEVASIGAKD